MFERIAFAEVAFAFALAVVERIVVVAIEMPHSLRKTSTYSKNLY